jgi:hypothetical protein
MDHVSFQNLVEYAEDELGAKERGEVESHVAACSRCQEQLGAVRRMLEDLRAGELSSPPQSVLARVWSAFRRKRARSEGRLPLLAALRFDSRARMAPAGVRGAPQEQQLLFSQDQLDLDLQIVKDVAAATFFLRGQVLDCEPPPEGLEGIEVRLTDETGTERRRVTDELGRFAFSDLGDGSYSLRVVFEDHDTIVETVVIEA